MSGVKVLFSFCVAVSCWFPMTELRAAEAAAPVVVETFQEDLQGALLSIDESRLVLETKSDPTSSAQRKTLPLSEVLRVRFLANQQEVSASNGELLLVDGSRIPHAAWSVEGNRLMVETSSDQGSEPVSAQAFETDWDRVASWRLPSDTRDRLEEWSQVEATPASDMLVVTTRDGGLRPVSGVIERVTGDGVRFLLEGDPIDVPWRRLAGLLFYRESDETEAPVIVHTVQGMRLVAQRVELEPPWLRCVAKSGDSYRLPVGSLNEIDLSTGKLFEFSRLRVIDSDWRPYFGSSDGEDYATGPISLRFPDPRADGVWQLRDFENGLTLRSRARLTLELPAGARQLRGWVGIEPEAATSGAVEVKIMADDRSVWRASIDGASPPHELRVALGGAERLTLLVDYGENLDTGDIVHFAELSVLR